MTTKTIEGKRETEQGEQKGQGRALPEGWRWVKLGDIAETCSGTTPSRKIADYYSGSIPWVKTGELLDNAISDTEEYISDLALKKTSLKVLPVNTVLIAMYGQGKTRGRTGRLLVPATTNQACFAILPNPEVFDSEFIQWWFRHIYLKLRQETDGRGGNQPNLNGKLLKARIVPLPPIAEQKRIVGILSDRLAAVDQARQATQAQLEAAQALPAAYLRQIFNSPEAQTWETLPLGDCLTHIQAGKSVSCVEIPANSDEWGVLKVSAVSWQKFDPEANKVLPSDFTPDPEHEVKTGDLLISRANTTELVGAVVLVRKTRPRLMLSDKTLRLDIKPQKAVKEYLEIVLREKQARAFIEENATGTSDSMKNISQKLIRKIPILLPSLETQKVISKRINNREPEIERMRQSLQDQLDTINALPAALLRQAFNGEL